VTNFGPFVPYIQSLYAVCIEVLFVKQTMFIDLLVLLLFASLPDCGQNQTAVSNEQYSLSDF
jgi:hypothetical protein